MNHPPLPDPVSHVAPYQQEWLDSKWEKANQQRQYQASPANPVPPYIPPTRKDSRELNGCEMILVILGGSLIFAGFLLPSAILAGLFCFIVALGLSAYRRT